jgi:hypothetical protein
MTSDFAYVEHMIACDPIPNAVGDRKRQAAQEGIQRW